MIKLLKSYFGATPVYKPLLLTLFVVLADQISKIIVVGSIAISGVGASFFNGFLRIIHESNRGMAFSMGNELGGFARALVIVALPVIVITVILLIVVLSGKVTSYQRFLLAGIAGGGVGNLIDRISREDGVVDFISVKFYGFLGMEYYPTFNVADSFVVVCSILLMISVLLSDIKKD